MLVRAVGADPGPSLAEDACVGAVAEAGSRTGFVGDFVRGLGPWAVVEEAFGDSWDGVGPRAVRADVFAAGFKEARLGLCARALDLSLATSLAEGCLVVVLADDFAAVAGAAELGLLGALLLAPLMFDGRLETVFWAGLSEAAFDSVLLGSLVAGFSFFTGTWSF